ncbi:MAG TPA: hypothetical protein PKE30_10235 [Niabella sp.]|nr:hypothetical protein [Niabella sp.]
MKYHPIPTSTSPKRRFYKPWHFLSQAGKLHTGLREVFCNYSLEELRQELQCWLQLALCNDNSAYAEASAREDLLDFTQDLQRLAEALYILNEKKNTGQKRKQLKTLPKQTRQIIAQENTPVLLTEEEKKKPEQVVSQFCKTFHRSYVQTELLDMLDAVITYKGDKQADKGNLVLFYEHLYVLVRVAYGFCKGKASFRR